MPTQKCLDNIAQEPAPFNIPCTGAFCAKTRPARDAHCETRGLDPDTPQLSWDPALDKSCYCCCSCYTLDTPIAVAKGKDSFEYAFIQDLNGGDTVLTAGKDLNWVPGKVEFRSGELEPSEIPGLYMVSYQMANETIPRELIVTADHLFMLADSRTLKKVQNLIPNDKLQAADGSEARVVFVAIGDTHLTAIQSIELEGEFDGENLEGHLLDANGVVSTDFKVQAFFETLVELNPRLWEAGVTDLNKIAEVGEEGYIKEFHTHELGEFLDDPEKWPKGFMPRRRKLVNIPANAMSFLRRDQAHEVHNNAFFNPVSASKDTILKVIDLYRSSFPDVFIILDWYQPLPNAFAWKSNTQKYVVITGEMARLKDLYTDGFALVIADMLTRLTNGSCVAEGDYQSLNTMRVIWPNSLLADMAPKGIQEVDKAIFSNIKKHCGGNDRRLCEDPSIDCRLESFWAGLSFFPQPECGIPPSRTFTLKRAFVNFELDGIEIEFSEPVEKSTGGTTLNYSIDKGVAVESAVVEGRKVKLGVAGLEMGTRYIVEVSNVRSVFEVVIQPNPSLVIVTTPILTE